MNLKGTILNQDGKGLKPVAFKLWVNRVQLAPPRRLQRELDRVDLHQLAQHIRPPDPGRRDNRALDPPPLAFELGPALINLVHLRALPTRSGTQVVNLRKSKGF